MKKYILLLIFMLLAGNLVASFSRENVIHLTSSKPTQTIRLLSNPTTGYSWGIVSYDHNLLNLVTHYFEKPKTNLIGAPTHEVWKFSLTKLAIQSKKKVTTNIKMSYARPWEIKKNRQLANAACEKIFEVKIN